jgi:hypothetical protein
MNSLKQEKVALLQKQADIARGKNGGASGTAQEQFSADTALATGQKQVVDLEGQQAARQASLKLKLAQEEADGEEQIAKKAIADRLVSENQGVAAVNAAIQKKIAAEQVYQQTVQAIDSLSEKQKEDLLNRSVEAVKKFNTQIAVDTQSAADKSLETARQNLNQITSVLGGALTGMIGTHEKLRDAERKLLLGIINDFASAAEKIAANWLATIGPLAALGGGAAGGLGAGAGLLGGVLHTIGIPGFASGSWELPRDMIAQVHAGEMILPKAQAD